MENKTGVNLIVLYTWIGAVIYALIALLFIGLIFLDPTASGIIVPILAVVIFGIFSSILCKLAKMTERLETKAWWGQMIISGLTLFQANFIALIIMIYLWINRKDFGVDV